MKGSLPACSTVGMVVLLSSSASLIIRSADEDDDDDEEWKKDEGVELWHDVNAWHDFAAENAKEGECLARRTANVVDKGRICIMVAGRLLRLWINDYQVVCSTLMVTKKRASRERRVE